MSMNNGLGNIGQNSIAWNTVNLTVKEGAKGEDKIATSKSISASAAMASQKDYISNQLQAGEIAKKAITPSSVQNQISISGSIAFNQAQAEQTANDLMSVATAAFHNCANADGTLSSEQMEVMMAVMMVAMGKIDQDDAKALIEAAEARNASEKEKMNKLQEMCEVMSLVSAANRGGCGAQARLTRKLQDMGYSRADAKMLAKTLRHMPPHMQFQFAQALVRGQVKVDRNNPFRPRITVNDPNANKEKSPIDNKMLHRLLAAQKEGKEQMMDLMLMLVAGNIANNIKNGAQAVMPGSTQVGLH